MSRRSTVALLVPLAAASPLAAQEVNLLALGEGTVVAVEPASYSTWPPIHAIDDAAGSGWAGESGKTGGQVFVFEMPATATIERFEFDNSCVDGAGRGAKGVRVAVGTAGATGAFTPVLEADLADHTPGQKFAAKARVPARFVRLEILGNHGDAAWVELCSFRGFGTPGKPPQLPEISGTYETDYSLFHVRQQGSALVGCYEHDDGLLTGTVEGRVMKITWQENGGPSDNGPAVMIFSPDGKDFRGWWWNGSTEDRGPAGTWDGVRKTTAVGSCPHWAGSVGGEVARQLEGARRARVYGIEFDTDSAKIRAESRVVLDDVIAALQAHGDWRLEIEGHTDATGGAEHNQRLSEARAAAVRDDFVAHGIAADRLRSSGFGASRPVADNATALGRSRNRRVEIVRP
jgi:outer membrane protein OmpA-like peptidoglycan-associated protein